MTEILLQLLTGAYASTGIIATIGYIPTIKDLFHKKMSANISSYMIWTFCSGITFAYSTTMFSDLLLSIVTGLNFTCCLLILGLALFVKNKRQ
ncbi:MAG: hypothetical protein ACP5N1_04510 [Candidatus Woesearchaeota archaeon]